MPYIRHMNREAIREFLLSVRAQNRAAAAIGVSPQHLSAWLQGRDGLSIPKLVALVDHLRSTHGLEVNLEEIAREISAASEVT